MNNKKKLPNLNKETLKLFNEKGYLIFDFIDKDKLTEVKKDLYLMVLDCLKLNYPKFIKKNKRNITIKNFVLNEGLIFLEKKNHKFLANIYDVIARTTSFLNLICDKKIVKVINFLLKRNKSSNLYINSNSIRMDMPNDKRFYYGWHRDNNTNIKGSDFLQLWMPIISNITSEIGGLRILEGSHLANLKTSETNNEKKLQKMKAPMRTNYDAIVYGKENFKEKLITLNLGQCVIFKNSLTHKGGLNKSKKVRYAANAFYHNTHLLDNKFVNLDFKAKKVKVQKTS
jgi:ectoine hydroxylase-related dioxygenase (phytanoyl-CoA dioxygenase family)